MGHTMTLIESKNRKSEFVTIISDRGFSKGKISWTIKVPKVLKAD